MVRIMVTLKHSPTAVRLYNSVDNCCAVGDYSTKVYYCALHDQRICQEYLILRRILGPWHMLVVLIDPPETNQ